MHTENGLPQLGVCTAEPWLAEEWSCTADHSNAWQFCTTEWPKMEEILRFQSLSLSAIKLFKAMSPDRISGVNIVAVCYQFMVCIV